MSIHVTAIKQRHLRRAVMLAAPLVLFPVMLVLGAIRGALDLADALHSSWGPAWRGEAGPPMSAEVGVERGKLMIHIPIDLLALAAEHGPFQHHLDPDTARPEDRFRVTDRVAFAKSVGKALLREQSETTGTLVHEMVDQAIEAVVDDQEPGFSWPAAGMAEVEMTSGHH